MLGYRRHFAITAILLTSLTFSAIGQPIDRTKYKADSLAMEAYIVSITDYISQPVVLKMADTLFNMAQKLNLPRRQSLALSYKVDYYYTNRITDSLFMAIDKVQEFTKKHNIPVHYYFSWYRKINYLIQNNQLNTAINETNLMQADALESGYIPAQVNAYKLMGQLYLQKKLDQEAYESYKDAIKLCESAPPDVEIPNKYYIYYAYAHTLLELNRFDEIIPILDKALSLTNLPAQKIPILLDFSRYYIKLGDIRKAEQYLNAAKALRPIDVLVGGDKAILVAEYLLAIYKRDGRKALVLVDSLKNLNFPNINISRLYADTYALLGDYKKAYKYSKRNLQIIDSMAIADMRNDINEMIVLNEVSKLKAEKDKKELDIKNQKLFYTRIILLAAIIVLIVISYFLYRILKLNHKLTKSENNLTHAVVKLEEESKVKSEFLHHLSHEVRTPLNALVGFCNLLIESNPPSDKNDKYGKVIQASSDMIIKFVSDAIDITNSSNIGQIVDVDINHSFDAALKYSPIKFSKDVMLKFEPYMGDNCIFPINEEKVVRILYNLIHNASKFTEQGQIVVSAEVDTADKIITYTVTDTGVGISKNLQDFVFEYFSKVDTMSQGLGLGLSLSRYLAEHMGGSLTIDSNYTSGCRFVLKFPY